MIKLTDKDKTLVVPAGLGNFGQSAGSGSGVTPEEAAQIASAVTAEALDEYDTELQVDLEDIRDAVSGNSEDISTLSAATETISQQIGSLSGLTDDIAAISGQTTANTQDIGILSGATEALSGSVETISTSLSAYTTNDTFNAGISELTEQISGLSAATEVIEENLETVSGKVGEVYDAIFYEDEGETYSQIDDLWNALDEKQDVLEAGSGVSVNGNVVSINPPGRAISLSESGRLQLNLGSGVTIGEDNELNLKIGDGLVFSGDTLVVSGGTSSNTKVVMLNDLTEQERVALYNELSSLYDYNANGWTSAYTEDMYAFYLDLRTFQQQDAAQTQDKYEGFFPMQCDRMHPSDYGGAAFFTGVQHSREGNGQLICIRLVITSDGQVDGPSTWINTPSQSPEYNRYLYITTAGTIADDQDWSSISDEEKAGIIRMRYNGSSNGEEAPTLGSLKWWRRYHITYNDEVKWYYVWSADVLIDSTVYTGVWGCIQDEWYSSSNVPPQLISWTSGATITLPYQPLP